MNIYDSFITYLVSIEGSLQGYSEAHRIIPAHEGGLYEEGNVVRCSFDNHKLAHFYRWLALETEKDRYAWRKMCGWRDEDARREMASYAGKLGGRKTAEIHKENGTNFFNSSWQSEQSLKRPPSMRSEAAKRMNKLLTLDQRSRAGRLGGESCTNRQRVGETGFFNPSHSVQKRGNLKRWGIKIDGVRVPYSSLSSDFIDYQINLGTAKEYFNSCNQQPSHPG